MILMESCLVPSWLCSSVIGSYDALVGGFTDAGLRDLCGLPCMSFLLPRNDMLQHDKDVRGAYFIISNKELRVTVALRSSSR